MPNWSARDRAMERDKLEDKLNRLSLDAIQKKRDYLAEAVKDKKGLTYNNPESLKSAKRDLSQMKSYLRRMAMVWQYPQKARSGGAEQYWREQKKAAKELEAFAKQVNRASTAPSRMRKTSASTRSKSSLRTRSTSSVRTRSYSRARSPRMR